VTTAPTPHSEAARDWPRPTTAQQDGDRILRLTKDGKFVSEFGKLGSAPGEFMGPHALAFDSQGRLRRRSIERQGAELGNIFAGLTSGCDTSASGGCLQKWVKK
jgi:hypothetical protein